MNWLKWLDAIAAADTVESANLPEISDEEARLYCEAITRATGGMDGEPRRPEWKRSYEESWEEFLRRSAAQQPKCGGDYDDEV